MRWVAAFPVVDNVSFMAVTESGHLAARAVDDLFRRHGAEVYRYAYAVLGNHADAEDVTQTTFLNAYRALEQGVQPRKPSNWLMTIASNAIKQRFRQEQARPRQVELDDRIAGSEADEDGPSIGELLTALSKIPPQQRQAIVLREFEGRSYAEIAQILGVTTSALETLLFRARRSLAEELVHQLTCTEAQLAISRSVDDRLGRKERRRLRDHLAECPDCAHFARLQQRHRSAMRGLLLVPIPLSLSIFKSLEGAGTASAATIPTAAGAGAGAAAMSTGLGAAGSVGGTAVAGGIAVKAAAVVAAVSVVGGVGVTGASEIDKKPEKTPATASTKAQRLGQVAPRGVLVPGNGVARGKASAPGQLKPAHSKAAGKKEGATRSGAEHGRPTAKKTSTHRGQTQRTAKTKRPERTGPTRRSTPAAKPNPPKQQKPTKPAASPPQQAQPSSQQPTTQPQGNANAYGQSEGTGNENNSTPSGNANGTDSGNGADKSKP